MNIPVHPELPPPFIPVAQPDGLIRLSDLMHDVVLQLPAWDELQPNDSCQLVLNGLAAGEPLRMPDPLPRGPLQLLIPVDLLTAEGIYHVAYRVTGYPGGIVLDSAVTVLRIDHCAPGATLLAPMIFPGINFGESLAAQIPGYAGMAIGDTLRTLCNGVQGPTCLVSAEHLDEQAIRIGFSRDFLEGLGHRDITFTYQVIDRAGNLSILAQPLTLSMPA